MKATFNQELQQAQQHISRRLCDTEPNRLNQVRAHLWLKWINQHIFNKPAQRRNRQGGKV